MLDDIRSAAKKAKQFAQEHRTVTACALTMVITARVSRNHVIKQVTPYMYQKGRMYGELEMVLDSAARSRDLAYSFIAHKNMGDELAEFVREQSM